ncbi:MAG: dienelactone hydrolase family protein [Chloroflexi bacterium]|nr:dienelactone hydrolase family protein [Chloroflexota bacterium]
MADITTDILDYATNGSNASGFLARPLGDGPFPAVVVVQEWWGLNDNIKDIAGRFAREGFVAFAPDLYHGKVTSEPDSAQKLMMQTDMPRASQELVKATEYLSQQPYVNGRGIGATGFCMGGGLALTLATDTPLIKAAAPFYGVNPQPIDKLQNLQGPVLAIYAEHDDWASAAVREALQSAMEQSGKQLDVQVYPGTEHAFFNDTRRDVYREAAANDAWNRVLTLFRAEL